MIHWISDYNYDFALASIPIQIILLIFFCSRRNLPIRQSFSFLMAMVCNLIMTSADLISCEMNEVWNAYPLPLMYLINILYFLGFIGRGWFLFDYTAESCMSYRYFFRLGQTLFALPALLSSALIVSTPWTGAIFQVTPAEGYFNCTLYPIIYFSTYFYIAASLFFVLIGWKHTGVRMKISLLGYNGILLAGIILRKQFMDTLVTSYFSILAILVIYLSAQNPDLYRDKKTRLFNRDAFDIIGTEYLYKKISFHCILVSTHNYAAAKALYGFHQLQRSLTIIGRFMIEQFPGYYVFYFGDGNFLLLRRGMFEEHRDQALKKLHERFEKPWLDEDTEVTLSMSYMVLPYHIMPNDIVRIDDLIRYLYEKAYVENVRGHIIAEEDMMENLSREETIEAVLGKALEEHRVETYLQPIYSSEEGKIVGAEALARLIDPELGIIPPGDFIGVAERTGDIMELGRQVFENVCRFIDEEKAVEQGLKFVNVNLSPAQCMNNQLVNELSEIAERHHVSMELFDFEITETSVDNHDQILQQMLRLQACGSELSLDDFGAGTSNLSRLLKLPIHVVKIDMDVVWSYFRGESSVLPDLVQMFQNADLKIVVEGVETAKMKDALADMGCDYQQGYYFSKPIPREEFLRLMQDWNTKV